MNTKKKVLIVEDDPDVRLGLSLLLGREFDVVTAEDSISGLMVARREAPDALVLDLGLPGGDGLEVLERLSDVPELAQLPTIVVTGRYGDEVVHAAIARGAYEVFHKPADPTELADTIRSAIESREPDPRHVLIVEDDADTREAIAARLRFEGYLVSVANDGVGALMQARKLRPDLVVLDLGLPCGDGLTVLDRIRGLDGLARVPVVVLSGKDACNESIAHGADVYLEKPSSGIEIAEAVRAVV